MKVPYSDILRARMQIFSRRFPKMPAQEAVNEIIRLNCMKAIEDYGPPILQSPPPKERVLRLVKG